MKNILLTILIASIIESPLALAQTSATLKIDTKFGFRDLKLESDLTTINNKYTLSKKDYSSGKVVTYGVNGMNMFIDDIPIEFITIDFIDGELYSIFLRIACDKSTSRLTTLIEESYGKLKEDTESHDYIIKGKKAELIYQPRGKQLDNGYIEGFALLTIRSLKLKKKITGEDNGF